MVLWGWGVGFLSLASFVHEVGHTVGDPRTVADSEVLHEKSRSPGVCYPGISFHFIFQSRWILPFK